MSENKNLQASGYSAQKNKSSIIALICVVCVVVIGIIAAGLYLIVNNGGKTKDAAYYLNIASNYFEEANYEEAIKNYWIVIDKEPSKVSAYIGLGRSYEALNNNKMAETVYLTGFNKTNINALRQLYSNVYFQNNGVFPVFDDNVSIDSLVEGNNKKTEKKVELNSSALNQFKNFTYGSYQTNYGIPHVETENGGIYKITFTSLNAILFYYDTSEDSNAIDKTILQPYTSKYPNEIQLKTLETVFTNMQDSISYEEISKMSFDNISRRKDVSLGDVIECRYDNLILTIKCEPDGSVKKDAYNRIKLPIIKTTNYYNISGVVVDAITGRPLTDVQITIKETASGNQVEKLKTDSNGYFISNDLEEGEYSIELAKDQYIGTSYSNIKVDSDTGNVYKEFVMTEQLAEGEIRIVLTWNEYPNDLDSYVFGTTSDGTNVRNYYGDKNTYNKDGSLAITLDIDDMDGFGPETTTIKDTNGTYEFVVSDFNVTGQISNSLATVQIYVGSSAPITVNVPSNVENTWSVCTIEKGVVTVTNIPYDNYSRTYDNK